MCGELSGGRPPVGAHACIYGAGAQGRVILDVLRAQGTYERIEFIDDDESRWGNEVNGVPIAGGLDYLLAQDRDTCQVVLAFGDPVLRRRVAEKIAEPGPTALNAVDPSAVIMPSAQLGSGDMIFASAVVNTDAVVGDHVIVNTGAVIEHDCIVEDFATVAPGVQMGGRTRLGAGAFVCTGAIVLPRVTIGAGSVVAAGSVVTKPVPENVLVLGAPARVHSNIDESFDWRRLL